MMCMPVVSSQLGLYRVEVGQVLIVHGTSGLYSPDIPRSNVQPTSVVNVAAWMHEKIMRSDQPVSLAMIGPATNVASLLEAHPDVISNLREIVFMGGSTERGNHTPYAEFNTYADPEALDLILKTDVQIRMIGLNLTHQALVTPEVVQEIKDRGGKLGEVVSEWMGFFGESYESVWKFDSPPLHDPCTIASIIEPGVCEWQSAPISVELEGRWTRGATSVDLDHRFSEDLPLIEVATKLNVPKYWEYIVGAVELLSSNMKMD